jgi:hypothetical protein
MRRRFCLSARVSVAYPQQRSVLAARCRRRSRACRVCHARSTQRHCGFGGDASAPSWLAGSVGAAAAPVAAPRRGASVARKHASGGVCVEFAAPAYPTPSDSSAGGADSFSDAPRGIEGAVAAGERAMLAAATRAAADSGGAKRARTCEDDAAAAVLPPPLPELPEPPAALAAAVRAAVTPRSVALRWRAEVAAASRGSGSAGSAAAADALADRLRGALVRVHPPRQQRYCLLHVLELGILPVYACPASALDAPGAAAQQNETLGLWLQGPDASWRHLYRLIDLSDSPPEPPELAAYVADQGGADAVTAAQPALADAAARIAAARAAAAPPRA